MNDMKEKARLIAQKAKQYVVDKKRDWANTVYQKTIKKLLLEEFPEELTPKSLKMHKSNEKMYPMLERVEAVVNFCIEKNRDNVGEAIH